MASRNTALKVATPIAQNGLALHNKATAEFRYVSPAEAAAWLTHPAPNRPLTQTTVREYAMKKRQQPGPDGLPIWRDYHPDAVCVNPDGQVFNGQHRLQAIVETQIGCVMLVVHYLDWALVQGLDLVLDRGKRRTTRDVLSLGMGKTVTTNQAACARSLYYGITPAVGQIPDKAFISFYARYQPEIEQACRLFTPGRKGLTLAPIIAATARALVSVRAERLIRFAEVLLTGASLTTAEHTIIALRNYCLSLDGHTGGAASADLYARTTTALQAYVQGKKIGTPLAAPAELFPLRRDA